MQKYLWLGIFLAVIIVTTIWSLINFNTQEEDVKIHLPKYGHYSYEVNGKNIDFDLRDPETAPADICPLVMRGYNIVLETRKNARQYTGDKLDCRNCHFAAGDTMGGKNNGISLVGVSKKYPRKLPNGKELSLAERIDLCFEKSMNGKKVPHDSPEMKAILAYFDWISSGVDKLSTFPWLGIKKLKSIDNHKPNLKNGARIYAHRCADCHGKQGQGIDISEGLSIPPVWGNDSFNDAAGFTELPAIASFIYENMPYDYISLTEAEAIDVAAYIIKQPRPHKAN